jgi:hypothetical protein
VFESQFTQGHNDSLSMEASPEGVLVADVADGHARGAEIQDTSLLHAFDRGDQEPVCFRRDDKSGIDRGQRLVKGIMGMLRRCCIDGDDAAWQRKHRPLIQDPCIQDDGDVVTGDMKVFRETAKHSCPRSDKARVGGLARKATGAEVFVEKNTHAAPTVTAHKKTGGIAGRFPPALNWHHEPSF